MAIIKKSESFGEHHRTLSEAAGLTLKSVSEQININTSLLANIERNKRQLTKQIIKEVAEYFNVDENKFQNNFLSDEILNQEADLNMLNLAKEKVISLKTFHLGK